VEELEEDARAVSTGPETELRSQMDGGGRQNARPAAAVAAARKGTADLPRQTELQTELFIGIPIPEDERPRAALGAKAGSKLGRRLTRPAQTAVPSRLQQPKSWGTADQGQESNR
jgi:hypothetical protein